MLRQQKVPAPAGTKPLRPFADPKSVAKWKVEKVYGQSLRMKKVSDFFASSK